MDIEDIIKKINSMRIDLKFIRDHAAELSIECKSYSKYSSVVLHEVITSLEEIEDELWDAELHLETKNQF